MTQTGWYSLRLGDAGTWVSGGTPTTSEASYWGGNIPWMSAKSLVDFKIKTSDRRLTPLGAASGTRLVQKDTILMIVRGMSLKTEFKMGITQREVALSQDLKGLIAHPGIDPLFLAYSLKARTPEILDMVDEAGHGTGRLQTDRLYGLELVIPPASEQHGIAATLGALDDKIESNQLAVKLAMHLARTHVDAMTANRSSVPYNEALDVRMGSAFKGSAFSAPGIGRPLLRIRDLKTFDSQIWTTEVRRDETVISPGDIVVGMDAEFRATLWLGENSVLNQRVCSFTGKPGVGRAFVLAVLEPELAFQEFSKTGTTVIHLNKADIDTFQVSGLSVAEHEELSRLTEPLIDLVVARSIENRQLVRLRDALFPELLTGHIRVAEAVAVVEEVVV